MCQPDIAESRQVSLTGRFPGIGVVPFGVDLPRLVDATSELVAAMRADKYVDMTAAYGWDIVTGHRPARHWRVRAGADRRADRRR